MPERWVPERILHGHLAGAGVLAEVACSGDGLMLTGPDCCADRWIACPCGTMLDEPLAPAACRADGRARAHARNAARLGVDYGTTATGVALVQGVLASLIARLRRCPTRD